MQQFNSRGGPYPSRDAAPAKVTFTAASLMKVLTVALVAGALFLTWRIAGPSSALAWNNDLDAARAQAAKVNKPILVYFTADWCPPCREMKKSTLSDEGVQLTLQNDWVLLKVDLSDRGGPESRLAQKLGVSSIPTFQVYHNNGDALDSRGGFMPPAVFLSWLQACKQRL